MQERYDPQCWDDLLLPSAVKGRLETLSRIPKALGDVIAHLLLVGPPEVEKQAIARFLANQAQVTLHAARAADLTNPGDLAGTLTTLERGDVLFIECIEEMNMTAAGHIRAAMQDFKLDVVIDQGENARSVHLNLPRFSLIGSTDDASKLRPELLDEFLSIIHLKPFSADEVAAILLRRDPWAGLTLEPKAAARIGEHSHGKLNRAFKLLGWVADYCSANKVSSIGEDAAAKALAVLGLDDAGSSVRPETEQ